ncbi:MAG: GNAT family N-acetyltransferase [Verrucomicrobia bacterium]|nr:GNAT family N-acetyltransferase [Verrucomicrobiota bacterium]
MGSAFRIHLGTDSPGTSHFSLILPVNHIAKNNRRRPKPSLPPIEIREMQLKDIPAVFELGQELFTAEEMPTLYRCWDDHELAELFNTNGETCLVAEANGEIVGFALGSVMEKPRNAWRYGWLEWLGVKKGYKRRGVATRLLNQLINLLIDKHARIMLVDTDARNHAALAFFRKHGFGQELRHVYLSQNLENHPKYLEKKLEEEETQL